MGPMTSQPRGQTCGFLGSPPEAEEMPRQEEGRVFSERLITKMCRDGGGVVSTQAVAAEGPLALGLSGRLRWVRVPRPEEL